MNEKRKKSILSQITSNKVGINKTTIIFVVVVVITLGTFSLDELDFETTTSTPLVAVTLDAAPVRCEATPLPADVKFLTAPESNTVRRKQRNNINITFLLLYNNNDDKFHKHKCP